MRTLYISLCTLLSVCPSMSAYSQRHEIQDPSIATLQVVSGTDWLSMPVSYLGGQPINIDFDQLSHDHHRYTYKIEHCDADWSTSEDIFESDYMQGGYSELTINDTEQSVNTNQLYTHYHLTIPNENCQITMSGNYRITVFDESNGNEGKQAFTACFMMIEPAVRIGITTTSNTDIDNNRGHQQVRLNVEHKDLRITRQEQLKTVVLQNRRWDNAVVNARPDYTSDGRSEWRHVAQLIFPAGNEYRKFEFLDVDHPTMGISAIRWDGTDYQVEVETDLSRPNYVHDESAQGSFYIRNSDNVANNSESNYGQVHFTLKAPQQQGEVYLNGDWTNDSFLPQYLMRYNETSQCYEATTPLKQGYYSYQYLMVAPDGTISPASSEGNFFQTRNKYQVLVYYRGTVDRTDRLVGYAESQ